VTDNDDDGDDTIKNFGTLTCSLPLADDGRPLANVRVSKYCAANTSVVTSKTRLSQRFSVIMTKNLGGNYWQYVQSFIKIGPMIRK